MTIRLPMDITDPDSWFEHQFTAYSAVADYANAPPRGMTNPPMNRTVRNELCEDLVEFGLKLTVPEWGGGFGRSAPTSPSYTKPHRLARTDSVRAHLMHGYKEHVRKGETLKKGSCFSRSLPAMPATHQDDAPDPHPDWHTYHPFPHTLNPIDRRGPVSLMKTPSAASSEKAKRSVRFAAEESKTLAEHLAQGGSPQNMEFIKTPSHEKALQLGKQMTLDASGKRPSAEVPGAKKDLGKDSAKDEDGNDHSERKIIDEKELDNRMRGLRGMSQLHRAGVRDRFRFGASASAGDPLVLNASSLNQANPGNWASDAAFLTKFHNSAIRIVDPSGLEVLKEPTKKKKKKKKQDDDEELKMSDSGLFVARYPIDGALVHLRRLRKKAFPNEVKKVVGPTPEEIAAAAVAKLKLEFGGGLLSRVRVTDEEKKEHADAVAASGYDVDYGAIGPG